MQKMKPKVSCPENPLIYIIVLNYKNWDDTIECLESIFRSDYKSFRVVVIDNASPNDSFKKIIDWAEGKQYTSHLTEKGPLNHLSFPPVSKPLKYNIIHDEDLHTNSHKKHGHQLILINSKENRGYAAGNNIGLKYALQDTDFCYAWILNNDTVVPSYSLKNFGKVAATSPETDMWGGKLYFYDRPDTLQAVGATYNKWLGTTKQTGRAVIDTGQYDNFQFTEDIKIIVGASVFVSKSFLETVGLMNEDLFLYFEEVDWAIRALQHNVKVGFIPGVHVFHKEGASIGKGSNSKSEVSDYFHLRNHLLISRKYFPLQFPIVRIALLFGAIVNRMLRREFSRIPIVLRSIQNSKRK